ncbi:unnamed protein product [Symbiodinium microadriaticum]|nr:unnamed protein product [Symbiodinium microadriaticum]
MADVAAATTVEGRYKALFRQWVVISTRLTWLWARYENVARKFHMKPISHPPTPQSIAEMVEVLESNCIMGQSHLALFAAELGGAYNHMMAVTNTVMSQETVISVCNRRNVAPMPIPPPPSGPPLPPVDKGKGKGKGKGGKGGKAPHHAESPGVNTAHAGKAG